MVTVSAQKADEPRHLFRIIRGGKFGFIDDKGSVVIEPTFDQAQDFSENYALVSVDRKKVFIDVTGKVSIVPKDFEPINGFTDGLARGNVTSGERYSKGYIDKTGKVVINNKDMWGACEFSEGLACIMGIRCSFIDTTGRCAIEGNFDEVTYFREGLASVKVSSKVRGANPKRAFIDKTGRIVIKPQYDVVQPFSEGLAAYGMGRGDDYMFGFINKAGDTVVKPRFEWTYQFSEGFAAVKLGGRWGYIDTKGQMVIQPRFDKAEEFTEGLAAVAIDGKWGYIDKGGKFVIPAKFNEAHSFRYGLAFVKVGGYDATWITDVVGDFDMNGKWGYINASGNYIWDPTN